MRGLYTEETRKLAMEVGDSNPGAYRIIDELTWFSDWYKMMQWCNKEGLIGSKLWMKYKDEFNCDSFKLGDWIKEQMWNEIPEEKRSVIKYDFI